MTKISKSAPAEPDRAPEPAPKTSSDEVQAVAETPSKAVAVLLKETNGVRHGAVVRGAIATIRDLVTGRAARAATEHDIAVAGRVVDL